jgi:hypothetical protein
MPISSSGGSSLSPPDVDLIIASLLRSVRGEDPANARNGVMTSLLTRRA